jgi:nicotinamidase-related amidase
MSDNDSNAINDFLSVYDRKRDELLDADALSSPGVFSGEEDFIRFADRDYELDRHWAFQIRPEETALIVVDLQEDFVNPGHPMCVPEAYRQIPRVNALVQGCRELGMPILFTEHSIAEDCSADFYQYWPPIAAGAIKEGKPGTRLYHGLDRQPGDRVISVKHTYDSFAGTNLDYVLRGQGIRTVIVCGTLTNFCCESTARTAYFLNYHVVFGADVSATDNAMAHTATLRTMRRGFARVMDYQPILQALCDGDQLHLDALAQRSGAATA